MPDAISLLDSIVEYIGARLRLEGFRLERRGRALALRAMVLLAAAAVGGLGLVFAAWGTALAISEWTGWKPAGPLSVGAICMAAGILALAALSRRRG